ncbi:uncharacterized protein LOC143342590 [Colletes latitarsis]|uniref:uncharacterized protein LOC143342590 n=1 Tax=Colletes latitarsis TaxID=2605962 RepID=UPI00403612F5
MMPIMDPDQRRKMLSDMDIAFKNLPPEAKEAYKHCMGTDAVYKSALPTALALAGVTFGISNVFNFGMPGKVCTALMGFLGYTLGKVHYSMECLERHAPSVASIIRSGAFPNRRFDQERSFVESSDNLIEQEPAWSINDTFDNSNQFDGTSNEFEEELSTDKPPNPKQHITYESLRKQNREEYNKKYGITRVVREKPKREEELEEDTFFRTETKENIWG